VSEQSTAWPWPDELDGVEAAPQSHRVLLDADGVRVLEVVVRAGVREPEHTHRYPSVMIVDRPARLRYYAAGNPGVDIAPSSSPGTQPRTELLGPEGPHAVENIDDHDYHAYRIEHAQIQPQSASG
jgi:hypothetical protein